jgi:hypothetical protein
VINTVRGTRQVCGIPDGRSETGSQVPVRFLPGFLRLDDLSPAALESLPARADRVLAFVHGAPWNSCACYEPRRNVNHGPFPPSEKSRTNLRLLSLLFPENLWQGPWMTKSVCRGPVRVVRAFAYGKGFFYVPVGASGLHAVLPGWRFPELRMRTRTKVIQGRVFALGVPS